MPFMFHATTLYGLYIQSININPSMQITKKTKAMQLKNGQFIATIPGFLVYIKKIQKGTALRWSDAGEGRIMIEIGS